VLAEPFEDDRVAVGAGDRFEPGYRVGISRRQRLCPLEVFERAPIVAGAPVGAAECA